MGVIDLKRECSTDRQNRSDKAQFCRRHKKAIEKESGGLPPFSFSSHHGKDSFQ